MLTATECEKNSKSAVTVDKLIAQCGLPGPCGEKLKCEGETFTINGFIDLNNIFSKKYYPQLPYEKFIVTDSAGSASIEVWPRGDDNESIFEKIMTARSLNRRKVFYYGQSPKEWIFITATAVFVLFDLLCTMPAT